MELEKMSKYARKKALQAMELRQRETEQPVEILVKKLVSVANDLTNSSKDMAFYGEAVGGIKLMNATMRRLKDFRDCLKRHKSQVQGLARSDYDAIVGMLQGALNQVEAVNARLVKIKHRKAV